MQRKPRSKPDKAPGHARLAAASPLASLVDAIKQGIRSGRFAPGQRLIEADLAAEFGLKRTAIRDALRVLAGDGIVELVPQKGARIRRMSREDLGALVPVLGGLLRTSLRLAIGRLGDPALRACLEVAQDAIRHARALEDFGQFQFATLRYTEVLHKAAANPYLDYLHAKLHPDIFHKQLGTAIKIADWDGFMLHHERMHAALMAGQLAAALAVMDEHEARMSAIFADVAEPPVWR